MRFLFPGLLVLWLIIGCTSRQSSNQIQTDSTEVPEQELWESTVILSNNGTITSRVQAGHIARFKGRDETQLDSGVVVDFYNKEGQHTSVLTSERGTVKGDSNDLYAWGNVVVISDSGQVLRTEAIRWDHNTDKIISDTFVTITTKFDTLYGFGLISDGTLENWEIKQPTGKTVRLIPLDLHRIQRIDSTKIDSIKNPQVDGIDSIEVSTE
jgi:LPS export ABC transporter protein LptC